VNLEVWPDVIPVIFITNQGANPIFIYPSLGGTINEEAINAAITLEPNTTAIFVTTGTLSGLTLVSTGLSAAGSDQSGATTLTSWMNVISTAAAGTGVALPVSSTSVWVTAP